MSQILNPGKPELFLPQRPPMLLVSRILEFTEDDVIAEADSKILEPFRTISVCGQEETLLLQDHMKCHRKKEDMRRELFQS